ncbi:hypothetical protein CRUP_038339 [Coryphaenoides rupestris]|nr:hypothetical protein CRUP_038339 [Coryphaenoides rupestris]
MHVVVHTPMAWTCLRWRCMSLATPSGWCTRRRLESIMRPYYQGPVGDPLKYDLPYEDKVRVWQLYGVRDSVSHTKRPGNSAHTEEPPVLLDLPENRSTVLLTRDAPDRCVSHFDAVAQIRGEAFFFKGQVLLEADPGRRPPGVLLRPAQIQRFWRGLPARPWTAWTPSTERPWTTKIVFFKGPKYWVFKDNNVEEGYPRPISDFGLPLEGVDAAFVWLHNDKTYFFNGHALTGGYDDPPAAPPHGQATTEYWRVPASDMEVAAGEEEGAGGGFPRLIAKDWLLCTEMQADAPDAEAKARGRGQRLHDHAENGYEVCSCTSDTASPLAPRSSLPRPSGSSRLSAGRCCRPSAPPPL